jgi:hypothetical protein
MFGRDKKFPNLNEYLQHRTKRHEREVSRRTAARDTLQVIGFLFMGGGFLAALRIGFLGLAFLGVALLLFLLASHLEKRRGPESADQAFRRAAGEASKQLWNRASSRRLHRELDSASTALLEEAALNWRRAKIALDHPFWTNGNLPLHYQHIRVQSEHAIEQAMDELVMIFGPLLPTVQTKRNVGDFVEEVLEDYVFNRPKAGNLPPQFDQAFEIAEKLNLLASEVETATEEVARDPALDAPPAVHSLDMCITELRATRQAEDELRQNLGG